MANPDPNELPAKQESPAQQGGFRRSRKFAISANTAAVIFLAAAITVMINWISIRHHWRLDWTHTHYYTLSEKTVALLKTVKEPIRCIVFFQPQQEVYEDVRALLREYLDKSDMLRVEYVDPNRDLGHTEQLMKEYDVSSPNVVIFSRGTGESKKSKYVYATDIIEYDTSGAMFGGPPKKKAFKGEQAFSSAIESVLEAKQPVIYFLTGHGERDPDSFDERSGYSTVSSYLKRDNLKVARLNMATSKQIPPDCDVLVAAGPVAVPAADVAALDQYLQDKGRLLVLLDAQKQSGLEDLLRRWNVTVDNDEVLAIVSLGGLGNALMHAVGTDYNPASPIVRKLEDQNTTFPLSRSLEVSSQPPQSTPDKPRVTWLIKSDEKFWGETDLDHIDRPRFDAADIKGPLILAAAVESGNLPGTDVNLPSTRMVVVGSSGFAANGAINAPNLDFFLNSINWLINKPERVMGISPKIPQEFRLNLTAIQVQTLKLTLLLGVPGCVAVFGAIVWWRRRR